MRLRSDSAISLLAIVGAVLVGLVVSLMTGKSAADIVSAFAEGAFGSPYAIGASLNRACVLAMVGLGFCWAYRAKLVNVGGEGQMAIGGMLATAMALYGPAAGLPAPLSYLLPLAAAAVGGCLWGGISGALKVRFGTNEVISSLLLTFIGAWVLYAATHSVHLLRQPMTSSTALPESLDVPATTQIPLLLGADSTSPVHLGLVLVLVCAVALWFLLEKTALGLELKATGLNERAARRFGIRPSLHILCAMAVAGAFAGVGGAFMVMGEQYNLKGDFTSGYGFDGLVVGLLARGSPLTVVLFAVFFGFLRSGGISMELAAGVPSSVIVMVQGLIILAVAGAAYLNRTEGT
jgi:simple sugar transport system permease protein